MRASFRRRSIVASHRGTTASIPARNGPNDPDVSSRGSGRLNDGRMTTGSSPARKVDDARARDVDRSALPKKDDGVRPSEPPEEEEEEEVPPEVAAAMDMDGGGGGGRGRGGAGGGGRGSMVDAVCMRRKSCGRRPAGRAEPFLRRDN